MKWKLIRQDALDSALAGVASVEEHKERLKNQLSDLKHQIKQLRLDKKIEMEDVEHMMRIKDGKRDVEFATKEAELRADLAEQLQKEKDKYADKVVSMLEDGKAELKEIYIEILARLPNVDVSVKRK